MKKILVLAVLAIMAVGSANAQIKIGSKNEKVETLGSVRMGAIALKYGFGDYYITGQTSNQFDDPIILDLGSTLEQARESFDGLLSLYDLGNKETADFKDANGREWFVMKVGGAGKGSMSFECRNKAQAGMFTIHRFEMVNLQKKLK